MFTFTVERRRGPVIQSSQGAMAIEGAFDSGNAKASLSTVVNPLTAVPAVTFIGRATSNITGMAARSGWFNWVFRITNAIGRTPTFTVVEDDGVNARDSYWSFTGLPPDLSSPVAWTYRPWFSYDQINWTRFANHAPSGSAGTPPYLSTFSHSAPFTQSPIYVCSMPMSNVADAVRRLAAINGNGLVSSTASWDGVSSTGAAKFKIGSTTSFTDEEGRAIAAQPLYGFKISSGAGNAPDGFPKRKVVITAGTHPMEHDGRQSFWGMVNSILAGDSVATAALARFDFYLYPLVNPTGVFAGYWRQDPHQPLLDSNRHWLAVDTQVECSNLMRPLISADVGGDCSVLLDVHGSLYTTFGYFVPAAWAATLGIDYANAIAAAIAATGFQCGSVSAFGDLPSGEGVMNWAKVSLGVDFSATPDLGPSFITSMADYGTVGNVHIRALNTMFDAAKFPPH